MIKSESTSSKNRSENDLRVAIIYANVGPMAEIRYSLATSLNSYHPRFSSRTVQVLRERTCHLAMKYLSLSLPLFLPASLFCAFRSYVTKTSRMLS